MKINGSLKKQSLNSLRVQIWCYSSLYPVIQRSPWLYLYCTVFSFTNKGERGERRYAWDIPATNFSLISTWRLKQGWPGRYWWQINLSYQKLIILYDFSTFLQYDFFQVSHSQALLMVSCHLGDREPGEGMKGPYHLWVSAVLLIRC